MHDQPTAGSNPAEDLGTERTVLIHVVEVYPATLRLSDVIRELGDPDDFSTRDGIERAVRELVNQDRNLRRIEEVFDCGTGLFRCYFG